MLLELVEHEPLGFQAALGFDLSFPLGPLFAFVPRSANGVWVGAMAVHGSEVLVVFGFCHGVSPCGRGAAEWVPAIPVPEWVLPVG